MALVGQLGFLVSEYPTGTINCSFFCLSDHNAALLHNVNRVLNASVQPVYHQMIARMAQQ